MPLNYKYIRTQAELEKLVPILMARPRWGFDTETTGLDPHTDKVVLIQIGNFEEQYVIDARTTNPEILRPFFESKNHKKLGHNLKFDYKMMRGSFGIEVEHCRDSYLGERILRNGYMHPKGFFTLEECLKRNGFVDELDKSLQDSFVGHQGDFSEDQLIYAATDVVYSELHAKNISEKLLHDGQAATYQLECDVMPVFGDIEFNGLVFNQDQWKKVMKENAAEAARIKKELDEMASPFCAVNLLGEIDSINYDSPEQILRLLQDMNIKVKVMDPVTKVERMVKITKTDKATQKQLKDLPIIKLIGKYRSAQKGLGTYGQSYLDAIHPKTGRIHMEVDQIGAQNGRPTNWGDVNFLNIPRDNRYRHAIVAQPGWVMETEDFSGCELRILAELSGEPSWVEAFLKGEDLHCIVASDLYGVPVTKKNENAKLRTPAKSLNFG